MKVKSKLKYQEKITKLYAKGLIQFIGNKVYKKCKKCRFVICGCFQNETNYKYAKYKKKTRR